MGQKLGRCVAISVVLMGAPSAASAQPGPGGSGTVGGRVELAVEGADLADALPVVVYLEAPDDAKPESSKPKVVLVRQAGARFDPAFLVVPAGTTIEMRNDDTIFHNVFSYSRPNDFNLGTYPRGQSRFMKLDTPGVVRIFCSIHDPMNGTIFVTPNRHYALVDGSGQFLLRDVPTGTYRLNTWSPALPVATRRVDVRPGPAAPLRIRIGDPEATSPAAADGR